MSPYFYNMKVSFDGLSKIIRILPGVENIDVQEDIYSPWKEFFNATANSWTAPAFSVVGGDPTVDDQVVTPYFFLLNDWKLKPAEEDRELNVTGNLLSIDKTPTFIPTDGNFNVKINSILPLLATTTIVNSSLSTEQQDQLDMIATVTAQNKVLLQAMQKILQADEIHTNTQIVLKERGTEIVILTKDVVGSNLDTTLTLTEPT